MLVFFLVFCLLGVGVHLYLHHRLVRGPEWPAPWGTVMTWALVVLGTSVPVSLVVSALAPRSVAQPFAWVAFIWMGFTFFLLVLLLPSELVRIGDWLASRGEGLVSPERRQFLARAFAGSVGVATFGLGAVSMAGALREVAVKRVRVPLRGLPRPLDGLRIVQLTDIHVGPMIGNGFMRELVDRTNALSPDVVAITGDLVDGSVADLAEHVAPLGELRARHGVYFCTGNHEYYSGADAWIAHLRSLGITVLENERVTVEHEGAALALAGVSDWTSDQFGGGHDLAKALEGKRPETPVVLLAHQPKHIDDAAAHGVTLQLSGHTHGGQIFPFNYLVRLQQPYVAGLHDHRGTKLYVSSGTGYWGPPMRLAIPAEITELTLASA
ncbi:MAG: metallophosphoesterase [Sandaracinaceae bacterium]|nr:metallophosphoesterase [Sandaracinaceae bacterium]